MSTPTVSVGERVGVFDSTSATGVTHFYGYGVYEGNDLIPGWEGIARELMPLHRAAWMKVLEVDVNELIAQSLALLEAESRILSEQGRADEIRPATTQAASEIVHQRRSELTSRLQWNAEQSIKWMQENERLLRSPRIKLDDGRTMWGHEVWWDSEESARARIEKMQAQGYTINMV